MADSGQAGTPAAGPSASMVWSAIEQCSDLVEPLDAQLAPVRELVVSIPAPGCDHRKHEDPALAKQVLIHRRIVFADVFGCMGDVELDRSAATRLKVDKQQPFLRPQQVARMRLAVQQLLGAPRSTIARLRLRSVLLRSSRPVSVKLRCVGAVADQPLRFRDSIREVRRRQIDLAHAGMLPLERLRILGWRDVSRRHRLVVGPQRDREAVTHVDARLHPRLKLCHRAAGFGEPPTDLDFELSACLMRYRRHPSENVTRSQAHGDAVRVVNNNCVIDPQVKRCARGHYPQPPHAERLMPSSSPLRSPPLIRKGFVMSNIPHVIPGSYARSAPLRRYRRHRALRSGRNPVPADLLRETTWSGGSVLALPLTRRQARSRGAASSRSAQHPSGPLHSGSWPPGRSLAGLTAIPVAVECSLQRERCT